MVTSRKAKIRIKAPRIYFEARFGRAWKANETQKGAEGGRLICRIRAQDRGDVTQGGAVSKTEAADMPKESSSGWERKNVPKSDGRQRA